MKKVWITYAWDDNEDQSIDFIAQELGAAGLEVKLDRWNIGAGKRLWEQIEHFICAKGGCDAWLFVATQASLSSEACKEEYAYALDRALSARGTTFPIIGLFTGTVDDDLVPAGIKTRLYVSMKDLDWKERIVAAAEGRDPHPNRQHVEPYYIKVHEKKSANHCYAIEVRPRAGTWAPFIVALPLEEKPSVDPFVVIGPKDVPTDGGVLTMVKEVELPDRVWAHTSADECTPTRSYYIWCAKLPSWIQFGADGKGPQHRVNLNRDG